MARSLSRRALALAPLGLAAAAGLGVSPGASAAAGGTATQPLAPLLPAADRVDVQDLFARYAWGLDCASEALWLASFTDDAVVIGVSAGQVFRGREAIRGWYRYLLDLRAKDDEDWLHDAYHHRMFGDRRSCLVYSFATQFNNSVAAKRIGVRSTGYFVSECVRRGGEWLFRRHSVNRWDRQQLPWDKPTPWAGIA